MAAEGDKIEYKDLISPDDSILEVLIQLEQLNKSYGTMVNAIRAGAKEIVFAMKSMSGATTEGKTQIDEATAAANRLERAEKELRFALSDTGKQVAWLKAQTSDANKVSVEQARQAKALVGSYDKLKSQLNENIKLWKSLSAAERANSEIGGAVLDSIMGLRKGLAELDAQVKPTVQKLTELQKAEERLAYLQSEEGQKLIALKRQISEITSGRKTEKTEIDKVAKAQERLSAAQSDENIQLQSLNQQALQANRIAKLTAQVNDSATGSYNQLAAQYELNKIKLNAMSAEERNSTQAGKELEEQTLRIYKQMIHLQEATGNHKLSVGNYAKAWDGLGVSVNNVIREIPSLAMGFNTFFLAISNNIPIVIDEIQRLKEKNAMLRAEGRPTTNIVKQIVSSIFSWQTALILCITALSMHGEKVIAWIRTLIKGPGAVMSLEERVKALNKELKDNNDSYGENLASYKKLQAEWKNLSSLKEQNEWIKNNESEFNKLGISIDNITEAEKAFESGTPYFIKALALRAKATAATKLAAEKYEQALLKQNRAETIEETGPSLWDVFVSASTLGMAGKADTRAENRAERLKTNAKALEAEGDAFIDHASALEAEADALLKLAGIEEYHKKKKGSQPRDLTDTINRNHLTLQKKYEESVTKLQRDEYLQRRKAAIDAVHDENRRLQEMYRKNEEYVKNVDGKYKALTEEQKKQIAAQQAGITQTIANNLAQLDFELEQLEKQHQVELLRIQQETIEGQLELAKKGSQEELAILIRKNEIARQLALAENLARPAAERQSEDLINQQFDLSAALTKGQFAMTRLDEAQALAEAEFNITKHNETEITKFKLEQEKERWERQVELAKAGGLDWSDAQIAAAEATIKGLERQIKEIDSFVNLIGEKGFGGALLTKMGFDDDQISALQDVTSIVLDNIQAIFDAEVELAEKQVELAKERVSAVQNAYDAEIEARNNGYANNVATAKKELQLEKKNQKEKERLLQEAQKRQESINTITQTSSLITASANLWSSLSSIPVVGPALAIAAIGTMFGSFAMAKVKANQVTRASQEYGEGGLEFLEGGSHASGNDIDLATRNSRGRNMRAEGGEAMAIINRRSTRRYRKQLPGIIESLNRGTFEDKYLRAFESGEVLQAQINSNSTRIDLSRIERDVQEIKKQNSSRYYALVDGTMLIVKGNVKKHIK